MEWNCADRILLREGLLSEETVQIEYPVLDKFAQLASLLSCGRSRDKTNQETGKEGAVGEGTEAVRGEHLA